MHRGHSCREIGVHREREIGVHSCREIGVHTEREIGVRELERENNEGKLES